MVNVLQIAGVRKLGLDNFQNTSVRLGNSFIHLKFVGAFQTMRRKDLIEIFKRRLFPLFECVLAPISWTETSIVDASLIFRNALRNRFLAQINEEVSTEIIKL